MTGEIRYGPGGFWVILAACGEKPPTGVETMKIFPVEFESRKEILFFPGKPERFVGDILEVGPGRGDFLLSAAEQCPDKIVVGIELGRIRYYKLIPRIERRRLSNVLLLQGNARIALPRFFPGGTFEKIYVFFPDPWPKNRHVPLRLMSVEFITLLADMLRPNGELLTATDFWPYASWVVDNARAVASLRNMGSPFFVPSEEIPYYNPTFYEQKWRGQGRAIYYMRFRKV